MSQSTLLRENSREFIQFFRLVQIRWWTGEKRNRIDKKTLVDLWRMSPFTVDRPERKRKRVIQFFDWSDFDGAWIVGVIGLIDRFFCCWLACDVISFIDDGGLAGVTSESGLCVCFRYMLVIGDRGSIPGLVAPVQLN